MVHNELWMTYNLVSRVLAGKPATAHLVELHFQDHKLVDLEDVLDHVFRQGFVGAKYRSVAFWERRDGQRIKGSHNVEDLLEQGVGKCEESALRLVVGEFEIQASALSSICSSNHRGCTICNLV